MRWEIVDPADPFGHTATFIKLLTVAELHDIQNSEPDKPLISIWGKIRRAGDCDDDERGGFTAFGVSE